MKSSKKAKLITLGILVLGILLILFGIFGSQIIGLFVKPIDPSVITSSDVGSSFDIVLNQPDIETDMQDKYLNTVESNDLENGYVWYLFDISGLSDKDLIKYKNAMGKPEVYVKLTGVLCEYTDDEYIRTRDSLTDFCHEYYQTYSQFFDLGFEEDEFVELESSSLSDYYIKVTGVGSFSREAYIAIGSVIVFVCLLLEICFIFSLKKKIVLPVAFIVVVVIPGILFFGQLRSALTIKEVDSGFYTMINYSCTDTDGLVSANLSSATDLFSWIIENDFHNIPITVDESNFGCAAFSATTPDGDHIFGRNFDYYDTDALLVYSEPDGGYASIGIADLTVLGVGSTCDISCDSTLGRLYMTAMPYVILDGINEAGFGAGILELDTEETHQDKGNPDLVIYSAIRVLLDKCATVDEAVELLSSYDIHSDIGVTYHLFVTDITGNFAVIEWLDNELVVTYSQICTNSVVAFGPHHDEGDPDSRFDTIAGGLSPDYIVTSGEAMEILSEVKNIASMTQWSCVYNLDTFSVEVCLDGDYDHVITVNASDFR